MGKPRKPRSDAKMYQLPKAVLDEVNERIMIYNMSYSDIIAWLAGQGYKISRSSLSRYAFKVVESAQRIADDLEKTKHIIDVIGRNPDLDTTQATSAILKSGLLQKISSAEEEFNDMPIEKAGRLFVQLIKADADRKRTDYHSPLLTSVKGRDSGCSGSVSIAVKTASTSTLEAGILKVYLPSPLSVSLMESPSLPVTVSLSSS